MRTRTSQLLLTIVEWCIVLQCKKEYVGENERVMGLRFTEHTSMTSGSKSFAVLDHMKATGHCVPEDTVKFLSMEDRKNPRKIREAVHIYLRKPQLNRDQGKEIPPRHPPTRTLT